jgi:hypothetical protein
MRQPAADPHAGKKKTFIIATLISTIIGTFTTGIGLYERVGEKRKQKKRDSSQDQKIKKLEQQIKDAEGKNNNKNNDNNSNNNNRKEVRGEDAEQSLRSGGPLIQREYERNLRRLGDRFAVGDCTSPLSRKLVREAADTDAHIAITQNQLQGQIITLQSTVINLLEDALYTGRIADINKLYNASELAREGSLAALQSQYQRMLQAAPLRRPPGFMRRISSTPTLKSLPAPPDGRSVADGSSRTEKNGTTLTVVKTKRDDIDPGGALFCNYSLELQSSPRQSLDASFSPSGDMTCPVCLTQVAVEQGRAWKIVKEVLHKRILTPTYDDEVIEDRTFLLGNRFVVKCHREGRGFACVLCSTSRDRDTICESAEGLVRHVWQKHEVGEYLTDVDIREIG